MMICHFTVMANHLHNNFVLLVDKAVRNLNYSNLKTFLSQNLDDVTFLEKEKLEKWNQAMVLAMLFTLAQVSAFAVFFVSGYGSLKKYCSDKLITLMKVWQKMCSIQYFIGVLCWKVQKTPSDHQSKFIPMIIKYVYDGRKIRSGWHQYLASERISVNWHSQHAVINNDNN